MKGLISVRCGLLFCVVGSSAFAQTVGSVRAQRSVTGIAPRTSPSSKPSAFVAVTAEEIGEAMDEARETAQLMIKAAEKAKRTTTEFETEHFLVFTDWPQADHDLIRRTLENAYTRICPLFEVSPRENAFVGKLPVYMFAQKEDFVRFASAADHYSASELSGYYHSSQSTGRGHLVSFAPQKANAGAALERWGYVLTHELTHAFVHRYRTNLYIPKWLNEGLAEVVATELFPRSNQKYQASARKTAFDTQSFMGLMRTERGFLDAEYYPVCQSMVRMLIAQDRRLLLPLMAAIKDGTPGEEALQKVYGVTYKQFLTEWRKWVQRTN